MRRRVCQPRPRGGHGEPAVAKQFHMRLASVAFVVLFLVATSPLASAPPKPGTYTPVPLVVTVHTQTTDGEPCGICGDAYPSDTDYTDGSEGVKAVIDQYGNPIIDFQTLQTQLRGLQFRDAGGATFSTGTNKYMATINQSADPPFIPLQQLQPGQSELVRSCPTYDDAANQRRFVHAFQRDCFITNSAAVNTSFLVVTDERLTVEDPRVWTVESQSSAGAPGDGLRHSHQGSDSAADLRRQAAS